jgi:hypothetical protein
MTPAIAAPVVADKVVQFGTAAPAGTGVWGGLLTFPLPPAVTVPCCCGAVFPPVVDCPWVYDI